MERFSYLFRMVPFEHELLNSLATRFQDKRETLAAGLRALQREVAEREAGNAATREAILKRLDALEEQLAALTRAPKKARPVPSSSRCGRCPGSLLFSTLIPGGL